MSVTRLRRSEAAAALIREWRSQEWYYLCQWGDSWQALHFVGGHREEGEGFRQCVVRELLEELPICLDEVEVSGEPLAHLEYVTFSLSARVPTRYILEVFAVFLDAAARRANVDRQPENCWVSQRDIRAGKASDGRRISPTVRLILGKLQENQNDALEPCWSSAVNSPSDILRYACSADLTDLVLSLPDGTLHTLHLSPCGECDEEHFCNINESGGLCLIVRRVHCEINDGLLLRGESHSPLAAQTQAALLWRAYRRYSELVGLKCLAGGLSASSVIVFRPRLYAPSFDHTGALASSGPAEVLAGAWGSPILIKTGPAKDIRQEWLRSETFLKDRQSPFLTHHDEFLEILPVGADPSEPVQPMATLFSSFLGGDLMHAESLDKVIRGTHDTDRCLRAIDQVVDHLGTWHTNPNVSTLAQWPRMFRFAQALPPVGYKPGESTDPWLLFGQFDFRKKRQKDPIAAPLPMAEGKLSLGRADFASGLGWDVPFGKTEHLFHHLLGRANRRDGLLYQLMKVPALFSLIHGDLNPRNVLNDSQKVWLIDFQHTGVGPILADLARLEINLRLWCISLSEPEENADRAARDLEWLLLDHFHGSETSLEPVRGFAHDLGADPIDLEKVARCITRIRRLARRWCVPQFTDGRDYLAITYLTLLGLLKFAGQGHTEAINERWALALFWVLEESLDLLLKREPFNREQEGYQPLAHLGAEWIRAAGAPLRVHELCATADGKTVLQPVVALRGVLQGSYHHLDAYRHTLTVLAYVEALIEDPVGRLLDPIGLDREVTESLAEAGLVSAPFLPNQAAEKIETLRLSEDHFGILKAFPKFSLSAEDKLLLKWCALFHDVGKPGTRTIRRKGKVAEVQFIGHEVYGLTLLRDRLEEWFPIQEQRLRLANLIRNHHYCHHLLGDYLLNAPNPEESSPLVKLIRLLQGEPRPEMVRWLGSLRDENNKDYRPDLTLLLLHGFADRLAARGLKQSNTVTEWAVAVLTLVTALRREPGLSDTEKSRKEQQKAKGLAAITWAEELVQRKQLQDGKRTQAVRLLKTSLEQTSGTAAELMDYLRVHTNVEALRQQLETL